MRALPCKPIAEMDSDKLDLELDARDAIPQLLQGVHSIFLPPPGRQEGVAILAGMCPAALALDTGRPGMAMWSIVVLGGRRLRVHGD
jgi:hypothetical protein